MRNLKLQFSKQITTSILDVKFLLLNPNARKNADDAYYFVTSSKLYGKSGSSTCELLDLVNIVAAEYLELDNEICLASEAGEVVIFKTGTRALSERTYCEAGIECMLWSPDQEVVVFVTKDHNVVVMTCSYDPIAEHSLADQSANAGQFMNVGWGKKETQFHGTAGKIAAKQQSSFQTPQNVAELPQEIFITWREDSNLFAVSFLSADAGRMFKVFDKEGILQFSSEPMNNLHPALAWRPSGTWLAIPQSLPQKSTIALFEKNGLRHREIVLPFKLVDEPIISLKWSLDSDVLAVETKVPVAGKNNLYLYTINNYHWYLKQMLSFELTDSIAVYNWDARAHKTLHVILQSGRYFIYSWKFGIDKFKHSGIVSVIDGKKLLLTNFAKGVVPPPMCHEELEFDVPLNACAFAGNTDDDGSSLLCVYDANQDLHLFKFKSDSTTIFERLATLKSTGEGLSSFCCLNKNLLIASRNSDENSELQLISLKPDEKVYRIANVVPVCGTIIALANGSNSSDLQCFAHTLDGKIIKYSVNNDNGSSYKLCNYAQLPQTVDCLEWFTSHHSKTSGLIALRSNQNLYIDEQLIAKDVTSFCLAGSDYLAFTQLSVLNFMRLADRCIVIDRKIERGGKLITTIANSARTVLQMPRGNLEAINPRLLVLEQMAELLEQKRYKSAMEILRKERVNLNILCDHNLCDFVEDLERFLDEIENPNWLNLFISDLQNEDYTQTMYASNYGSRTLRYPEGFKIADKVTYLCEKLCDRMELRSSNEDRFRLPIVTAYCKLGKLEKALELIWQQKREECSINNALKHQHADEALKYLLYLVDVNELYNVALGTYDFGLVLFVAQKSQKDPKEFLPFLNELKQYEQKYRKFKIDEHLKRYEKALQHIAQCGSANFDEALTFIKRHLLFQLALKNYESQDNAECYKQICLAFGDHLRANGKLENASLMYERGGNLTQALLSAKHVLDWQRVLALARQDAAQNVSNVALSLVAPLQENGKFDVAFELLKTYGNDFVAALQSLVNGRDFLKAIYEARMQQGGAGDADLIATVIMPALLAYRTVLETAMQSDQTLFLQQKERLLNLRQKKVTQTNALDFDDMVDEFDLLSDTTSVRSSRYTGTSSQGTGKTFRSSKNRRKHERKLLSLKPGNPFEDIALIDALHNLITRLASQDQQLHMRATCKALLELRHDVEADSLQQLYKQLLALMQKSLDDIWIPEIMTAQQWLNGPNIDYTLLQNEQRYAMIDPQKRFKPQISIITWEHEILS